MFTIYFQRCRVRGLQTAGSGSELPKGLAPSSTTLSILPGDTQPQNPFPHTDNTPWQQARDTNRPQMEEKRTSRTSTRSTGRYFLSSVKFLAGRKMRNCCCFTTCSWHFRPPTLDQSLRGGKAKDGQGRSRSPPNSSLSGRVMRRTSPRSLYETGRPGDVLVFPNLVPALTSLLPGVPTRLAGLAPPPNPGLRCSAPRFSSALPSPRSLRKAQHPHTKRLTLPELPAQGRTAAGLDLHAGRQNPRASPPRGEPLAPKVVPSCSAWSTTRPPRVRAYPVPAALCLKVIAWPKPPQEPPQETRFR